MKPLLNGSATTWRNAILIEGPQRESRPPYSGIRTVNSSTTTKGKYVEYEGGEKEFYDLNADPYERTNTYDPAATPDTLVSRLQALKECEYNGAVTCQAAENGQ